MKTPPSFTGGPVFAGERVFIRKPLQKPLEGPWKPSRAFLAFYRADGWVA
jgi:hypothetical protein